MCVANNTANVNQSALLSSAYPFATYDVARTIIMPGANERTVTVQGIASTPTMISAGRQAMFFVAWGVITLFYCIIAVLVYVVTMAKADDLGRIYLALVYTVSESVVLGQGGGGGGGGGICGVCVCIFCSAFSVVILLATEEVQHRHVPPAPPGFWLHPLLVFHVAGGVC